jgi:hypothetical protein
MDDSTDPTVSVAVVPTRVEADLIAGLLVSHGIAAEVVAGDAGGTQPQWQLEGVHVLVGRADESLARQLLAEG